MKILGLILLLVQSISAPTETLVHTASEFNTAAGQARPGDIIVMADGIWHDAVLEFDADGLAGDSITVRAESPGGVMLTGQSRLRIGGQYLKVDGLWFHRGALQGGHVIQFRTRRAAHHSRLTNCAVTEYNPANWLLQYKWVSLYGTHNRVDYCFFAGKTHDGATLVVWLEDPPDDKPNYHRIDHNHFGWRPVLGKNGGETIRIGTSSRSMQDSRTVVEHNLFHRTNGEHEIISNKSGHNIYRHNTFLEAQGALTLRHGNHAVVTHNYFLGNGVPGTGGVRVIGEDHTVAHNYFADLQGDSSRASLSIMNGIPNSPLNRYFQVKRPVIKRNTFIDTRISILYGLGADGEKTLLPEDVQISGNVIITGSDKPVITAQVSAQEVNWSDNIFFGSSLGIPQPEGIAWEQVPLQGNPDGLYFPALEQKGASLSAPPLTAAEVGPLWWGQSWTPDILSDTTRTLPDFSYAGYHWGEQSPPDYPTVLDVTDFGATGDDMNDDTRGFHAALAEAHLRSGLVVLEIPGGNYHLSGVLLIERDSLVLRGRGPDETTLYIEKPLSALDVPAGSNDLMSTGTARGRPVSPFTQAGGVIWSQMPGQPLEGASTEITEGIKGSHRIKVSDPDLIPVPAGVSVTWENQNQQTLSVTGRSGDVLLTKEPLSANISGDQGARLTVLNQLREIGLEQFTLEFEQVPYGGHQLEDGYNAIYLNQVRHSWVRNVKIINADAGIILRRSSQVDLSSIEVTGRTGHIGVQLIDTWHTLGRDIQVESDMIHPIGSYGRSGYNVFLGGRADHVFDISPLDPNLYDRILMQPPDAMRPLWTVDVTTPLVLWNVRISYGLPHAMRLPAYLGELGPRATAVGLSSTVPVRLQSDPAAYLNGVNRPGMSLPSLYKRQLQHRLAAGSQLF